MENNHQTMHDLPASDRPYEKLLAKGAGALTDAELLAVIIRSGSRTETALALSQRLVRHHGSVPGATGTARPRPCVWAARSCRAAVSMH